MSVRGAGKVKEEEQEGNWDGGQEEEQEGYQDVYQDGDGEEDQVADQE